MRSSITFRDNERTPLFRLKLPVNVFGLSLFAGMAAGPNSGDLALQLGSRSEVGPSWRVRFRPNEEAPPSLIVKAGVGPWGSVVNGLLSMCAEFDIGKGGVTSFKIRAKPRFGDFSIGHGPIHYRHVSARGNSSSGNGLMSNGSFYGGRSLKGRGVGMVDDMAMECGIPLPSDRTPGLAATRGSYSLGAAAKGGDGGLSDRLAATRGSYSLGGAAKGGDGGESDRFVGGLLADMGVSTGGADGINVQHDNGGGAILSNGTGDVHDGAATAPITPLIPQHNRSASVLSAVASADDDKRGATVFGSGAEKGSPRLLVPNGPVLRPHGERMGGNGGDSEDVRGEDAGGFGGSDGLVNSRSRRLSKGLSSSLNALDGQRRENWNWGDWFVNVHSQLPVGKWAMANFRWTVRLFPRDDEKDDDGASDGGQNWFLGPLGRLKQRPSLSLEKVSFESFYEDRALLEGALLGGAGARASTQSGIAGAEFGAKSRHHAMLGGAGSRKGRSGSTVTVNIPLGSGPTGDGEMEPGSGMAGGSPVGGGRISRGVPTCGEQVQYLWSENAKLKKAMEDLRIEFHRLSSNGVGSGAAGGGNRRKGGGEAERTDGPRGSGEGGYGGGQGGSGQHGATNGRGRGGREEQGMKDGRSGGVSDMGIPLPSDISEELKRAIMNAKNQ